MQNNKLKLRDCVENIPKVKVQLRVKRRFKCANCNFPPFKRKKKIN